MKKYKIPLTLFLIILIGGIFTLQSCRKFSDLTDIDVLIKDDLRHYLSEQYKDKNITDSEIEQVIRQLEVYSDDDLYESNKSIMKLISDGFVFKREDPNAKDFLVYLIDYSEENNNIYKMVSRSVNNLLVGCESYYPCDNEWAFGVLSLSL